MNARPPIWRLGSCAQESGFLAYLICSALLTSFRTTVRQRYQLVLGKPPQCQADLCGHSSALSALLALKLVGSGATMPSILEAACQLLEVLNGLQEGDVLWMMAFRRGPFLIQEIRQIAAERVAKALPSRTSERPGSSLHPDIRSRRREAHGSLWSFS
ncbi:hypothetical protein DB728_16130 [Rhizobium leguminosarum bv. viciae USDA 2370]|nr:hypothetical protein BS629_28125 [Rhizobium leguminosarum bv. viciae USDA 2370]PUB63235.1 hypothetical protein DB728_16130 [Rhizobium leguminosarum bv. viciae USDA 2370]